MPGHGYGHHEKLLLDIGARAGTSEFADAAIEASTRQNGAGCSPEFPIRVWASLVVRRKGAL